MSGFEISFDNEELVLVYRMHKEAGEGLMVVGGNSIENIGFVGLKVYQ